MNIRKLPLPRTFVFWRSESFIFLKYISAVFIAIPWDTARTVFPSLLSRMVFTPLTTLSWTSKNVSAPQVKTAAAGFENFQTAQD